MSQLEPFRIEFFGDEVDGIRTFEVETQLSKENQTNLTIFPASDILLREKDYQRGQFSFRKANFKDSITNFKIIFGRDFVKFFIKKQSTFR